MYTTSFRQRIAGAAVIILSATPNTVVAQSIGPLDSLIAGALAANPRLRALDARVSAARARIGPAGAWPDPMLMAGIQNLPLSSNSGMGPEPMTMRMAGVTQTVPYPGKTSPRTSAARAQADAAGAGLAAFRLALVRDVASTYHDLALARAVLALVERQQQVAGGIVPAAEARYVAGTTAQSDVIRARTEAAMLVEERTAAEQQERAALARLNAALNRPGGTPVRSEPISDDVVSTRPTSLDSLHAIAMRDSPVLRERRAIIRARAAHVELARRDHLPDFDVGVQYGQRDRLPDMITATIALPIPLQRGRKQAAEASAARFELAEAEADLRAEENELLAEITRTHAEIERQRTNAGLLARAILPQARATFASAAGSYQTGRGELLNVLDAMRAMFAAETMYVRTLAELAKANVALRALVGEEVTP